MTKTTAEELAQVIYEGELNWLNAEELAQAILASPVIAKIERDAEMRVVEWLREQDGHGEWSEAADAYEAQEHKEKAE